MTVFEILTGMWISPKLAANDNMSERMKAALESVTYMFDLITGDGE